jgi:hypothetical protein
MSMQTSAYQKQAPQPSISPHPIFHFHNESTFFDALKSTHIWVFVFSEEGFSFGELNVNARLIELRYENL